MASRIFPTQQNEKLNSSSVVRTINLDTLATDLDKFAGVKTEMTKTASVSDKVGRKKKRYSMKATMCETCGVEHPCSCDVVKAQADGDHEKVAQYLEERANRRFAKMQQIEETVAVQELNTRSAMRSHLLGELQKFAENDEEEADVEACGKGCFVPFTGKKCKECGSDPCKCKKDKKESCTCKDGDCTCKKASAEYEALNKLSASKKEQFAKFAEAYGWPVQYVEAITASSVKVASIPQATKLVLANKSIEAASKKQLIIAMHKEAKLAPEQASRIKTYWSQELGYPDTDWISDLVEEPTGK